MNNRLICTKFAHDYAYYLIENGKEKTVDSSYLNPLETKLIQNDILKLPNNTSVNGTYGYYFDVNTKTLKRSVWSYDTKKDDRGYLEVQFISLDDIDSININQEFLSSLRTLLLTTYIFFEKELYSLFSIDLNSLFAVKPSNEDLELFLSLYFNFLPSSIASRIIFVNNYSEYSIKIGKSVSCKADNLSDEYKISEIEKYCLISWINNSITSFEYKTLLHLSWLQIFRYDIKIKPYCKDTVSVTENKTLKLVNNPIEPPLIDKFDITFKFYESFTEKTLDSKTTLIISKFISNLMQKILEELYSISDFKEKLELYKYILSKLKSLPKGSPIYSDLNEYLYFSAKDIHDNVESLSYIQRCFKILSTLDTNIFDIDAEYYSKICFNFVKSVKSATELKGKIKSIDNSCSITDFFNIVQVKYIQDSISTLYDSILNKSLILLKEYHGYCDTSDLKFTSLNTELELIIELANIINKNPKQTYLSMYANSCKDKMLLQNLAIYYINEDTISLTELLNLLKDFTIKDFFTRFNLAIFDGLISALNRSSIANNEKIQLIKLFELYKSFRYEFDDIINICMEQKYSKDSLNNDIYNLSLKSQYFIKTYLSTYNVCKSNEAKQILCILNKNIIGNPSLSAMIMYIYTENIVGKTMFHNYTYYYQLYRLLFDFLIEKEDLSINQIEYLQDISKKNSSIFHKETFLNKTSFKIKSLFNKISYNKSSFKNIIDVVSIPSISKKFINTLHEDLSKQYDIKDEQYKKLLLKELQDYNNAYKCLFSNSILNQHYYDYVSMLINYITQQIKR